MVKTKVILLLLCVTAVAGYAQDYSWSSSSMDGSRTGCIPVTQDNINEALGRFLDDGRYMAPDGGIYDKSSTVYKVASIVHDAQPAMTRVKKVIAHSEQEMQTAKGESPLSNWYVGIIMDKVSALSGKKIDVGICNFGGIRVNMPKGDVILDDMLSMFPFRNDVVYLELKGADLRKLFETMAQTRFQAIGGVEIVAEDGKLVKALIGGQPIDDARLYSVATITFLLYGGDNLSLADNAVNLKSYDVQIIDAVLEHVNALTAEGKSITPPEVNYVTVK